jgi:hypothetical protein
MAIDVSVANPLAHRQDSQAQMEKLEESKHTIHAY